MFNMKLSLGSSMFKRLTEKEFKVFKFLTHELISDINKTFYLNSGQNDPHGWKVQLLCFLLSFSRIIYWCFYFRSATHLRKNFSPTLLRWRMHRPVCFTVAITRSRLFSLMTTKTNILNGNGRLKSRKIGIRSDFLDVIKRLIVSWE